MHKTEGTYNVAGEFVDEVPGVSPGTIVEEGWLNTVQRELVNIVEEADIALDSGNDAQVLAALAVLFRGYVKTIIVTDDDHIILPNDWHEEILANPITGDHNIYLPDISVAAVAGRPITLRYIGDGTYDQDIVPFGTNKIGGYNANWKLNGVGQFVKLMPDPDNADWRVGPCLGTLLEFTSEADVAIAGATSGVWANPTGHSLSITPGVLWEAEYFSLTYGRDESSKVLDLRTTLHTTNNAATVAHTSRNYFGDSHAAATLDFTGTHTKKFYLTVATTTTYYLNLFCASDAGGSLTLSCSSSVGRSFIRARRIA